MIRRIQQYATTVSLLFKKPANPELLKIRLGWYPKVNFWNCWSRTSYRPEAFHCLTKSIKSLQEQTIDYL